MGNNCQTTLPIDNNAAAPSEYLNSNIDFTSNPQQRSNTDGDYGSSGSSRRVDLGMSPLRPAEPRIDTDITTLSSGSSILCLSDLDEKYSAERPTTCAEIPFVDFSL